VFYVYILKNKKKGNLYIGYTTDLRKRLKEHISGLVYTTKRYGSDVELVYYEAYKNEFDAKDRERSFKKSGSVYNGLVKRIKRSIQSNKGL
jgi:putative endonuclease